MTDQPANQPNQRARLHARVFALGSCGWLLALVVLWLLRAAGSLDSGRWPWVCLLGALLGLVGVGYCRRSWRAG